MYRLWSERRKRVAILSKFDQLLWAHFRILYSRIWIKIFLNFWPIISFQGFGIIYNYHPSDDDFENSNLNCTWVLHPQKANSDMVVTLEKWDFFDIEFSQSCDWDYIEIFDGPDTNSPSLGRFCGREAPKYIRFDLTHNVLYYTYIYYI